MVLLRKAEAPTAFTAFATARNLDLRLLRAPPTVAAVPDTPDSAGAAPVLSLAVLDRLAENPADRH